MKESTARLRGSAATLINPGSINSIMKKHLVIGALFSEQID
jgi:hypothetical protein